MPSSVNQLLRGEFCLTEITMTRFWQPALAELKMEMSLTHFLELQTEELLSKTLKSKNNVCPIRKTIQVTLWLLQVDYS